MTDQTMHGPDSHRHRLARIRASLRCVDCRCALEDFEQALRCIGCGAQYPVLGGRPILMTKQARKEFDRILATHEGKRMIREYSEPAEAPEPAVVPSWLRMLTPPSVMLRYRVDLRQPPTAVLFDQADGVSPLTLSVGGGPYRVTDNEITLNIGLFPNVDMVADAHDIPVADDTFDAVFSLAVLEHVADPYKVVAEMIRVIKPGGYLYSEVPFIFFFHGFPTDYTRFTREGMKRLFSGLESAKVGMTHGPVSAMLQSANMILPMLLPSRPRMLLKIANGAYRWVLFPFKYLDLALREHPDAHTLAGGFYVLGRKPVRA